MRAVPFAEEEVRCRSGVLPIGSVLVVDDDDDMRALVTGSLTRGNVPCTEATSGEAVPVCEGPPGTNVCILDCSEGECPTGMECIDVFGNGMFLRCVWP